MAGCREAASGENGKHADGEEQKIGDTAAGADREDMMTLERDLSEAITEVDKWGILSGYAVRNFQAHQDATGLDDVEQRIKTQFLAVHVLSDVLLETYPSVTKKLEFDVDDLAKIAARLESDDQPVWDQERGGVRQYMTTHRTFGEMATEWLFILTGRKFSTKAEFQQWFEDVRADLKWDQESGSFKL